MSDGSDSARASSSSGRLFELLRSPLILAVIGGVVTLFANVVTGIFNTQNTLQLERDKFQSDLISKFLEPPAEETRKANLRFLADSGLIPDYGDRIKTFVHDHPDEIPQTVNLGLVQPSAGAFGADNRLDVTADDRFAEIRKATFNINKRTGGNEPPDSCTGFLISPDTIATTVQCVPENPDAKGDITIIGTAADANAKAAVAAFSVVGDRSDKNGVIGLIKLAEAYRGAKPLALATSAPELNEGLMLVYSPAPGHLLAAYDDECKISEIADTAIAYRCDASPGSGGGPVIAIATGKVVAVHTVRANETRYGARLDNVNLTSP